MPGTLFTAPAHPPAPGDHSRPPPIRPRSPRKDAGHRRAARQHRYRGAAASKHRHAEARAGSGADLGLCRRGESGGLEARQRGQRP